MQSKFRPRRFNAQQALFLEPGIGETNTAGDRFLLFVSSPFWNVLEVRLDALGRLTGSASDDDAWAAATVFSNKGASDDESTGQDDQTASASPRTSRASP